MGGEGEGGGGEEGEREGEGASVYARKKEGFVCDWWEGRPMRRCSWSGVR